MTANTGSRQITWSYTQLYSEVTFPEAGIESSVIDVVKKCNQLMTI